MKSRLEMLIGEGIQSLFRVSDIAFSVDHTELVHGDFATNAALLVAKAVGKNPAEVADALARYLVEHKDPMVESVSTAGPGFINFTLSPAYFSQVLAQSLEQKEEWGKNDLFKNKQILVEHSSPNLFKPFHIGHVMNNTIGESIVRLARFSSAEVHAISYPSDVSLGIGKAIWALLRDGKEKLENLQTIEEKLSYLGDCYVRGTRSFDEDENIQFKVREITKKLYEEIPGPELSAYEVGRKINLDYFLSIVNRLGSYFDGGFIFESEAAVAGGKIIRDNTPGIFEQSDGAIIYRGEQDGLHTRVFINKEGYPTYEAKDIGLMSLKFAKFIPDISIFITDHEQSSYFEVVLAAAAKINPEWKSHSIHRTHGRMSFKGQKMSSRLGGVPIAQNVLDTIVEEVKERSADLSSAAQDAIAIGALKFVILRTMAGKNINFDPDTSLSFEGDSGPYLQYTAVRASSIISKAADIGLVPVVKIGEETIDVERLIARLPEVVIRATREWAPHYIVTHLLELAQAFNSWYGNTKILDEADPATVHRLAITQSVHYTIKNGLWLLGINTPDKM